MAWDPAQYLKFEAERARPFHDLVGRVEVRAPQRGVDLGGGPGNVTATMLDSWPAATVLGVDSSPEMIARARGLAGPRLDFVVGDIGSWRPDGPVDVIVSNAALQWVPIHVELLPHWMAALTDDGALAFQVPSNVDSGAARIFREVAARPRWCGQLGSVAASWGTGWMPGRPPTTTCCPARMPSWSGTRARGYGRSSTRCRPPTGRTSARRSRRSCGWRSRRGTTGPSCPSAVCSSSPTATDPPARAGSSRPWSARGGQERTASEPR